MMGYSKISGQALTELLITTGFLLLPMMLMLPMLMRFMDLQHRVQQSAHYQAWEGTLSLDPALSPDERWRAIRERLWDSDENPIRATDPSKANPAVSDLPALLKVWSPVEQDFVSLTGPLTTKSLKLTQTMGEPNNAAQYARNFLFKPLALTGYQPNIGGLLSSDSQLTFPEITWLPGFEDVPGGFDMSGKLVLLTDGWDSNSYEHAEDTVKDLIPMAHLGRLVGGINGVSQLGNLVGTALPWIKPINQLELGKVDARIVPAQRETNIK